MLNSFEDREAPAAKSNLAMSADKDILGVSTSLLTVLALAATSKLWVLGLPILLVVDAVEELRSQGIALLLSYSNESYTLQSQEGNVISGKVLHVFPAH